jgi:hypothetical protein
MNNTNPSGKTKVDPTFKMVFWTITVLSVACLATNILMAVLIKEPTHRAKANRPGYQCLLRLCS